MDEPTNGEIYRLLQSVKTDHGDELTEIKTDVKGITRTLTRHELEIERLKYAHEAGPKNRRSEDRGERITISLPPPNWQNVIKGLAIALGAAGTAAATYFKVIAP